jgi:Ca2+-binding EF-hand superfamily protein/catechol 2,3-dioxygenase-like lactoylglutathione lyase family enzyme
MAGTHHDDATDEIWRSTFDFFDVDRSGTISCTEMCQSFHALGQKVSEEQVIELLSEHGVDSKDGVDYKHFSKLMRSEKYNTICRTTAKHFFQTMDKDRSGYITTAELCASLTPLAKTLSDESMNKIMNRYDADGNGTLNFDEFVALIKDHGFSVTDDETEAPVIPAAKSNKQDQILDDFVDVDDPKLIAVVKSFANDKGKVSLSQFQRAVDLCRKSSEGDHNAENDPSLHWTKNRVKPGLGELIYKANHIAIIVSDVAKSAAFYTEVMGFQQVRRPDFDRHGAWFTMGNLELHLIKGVPVVHSGADLIVGHISIETYEIDRVPEILRKLGVPFRQNVSVPKGKMSQGSGTNASNVSSNIVKQFFLRDPDGYYLEICNCDVLSKYCLGDVEELAGYEEGGGSIELTEGGSFVTFGLKIADVARRRQLELIKFAEGMHDKPICEIAQGLGCGIPGEVVDEEKFKKLLVRRTVYGDVCQNESPESMREIMLAADNRLPLAMRIMEVRAIKVQKFVPPAFFEEGTTKFAPQAVTISKQDSPKKKQRC